MSILKLISNRNYGIYNKDIAKKYGIETAIILGELASEYDYFDIQNLLLNGEWFYSTTKNIENNTGLTYYQQTKALNVLIKLEIIEQKVMGIPAKRYFKFNEERLENALNLQYSKNLKTSIQKQSFSRKK